MTVEEALKLYPPDLFDLVFDESGFLIAVAPKVRTSKSLET